MTNNPEDVSLPELKNRLKDLDEKITVEKQRIVFVTTNKEISIQVEKIKKQYVVCDWREIIYRMALDYRANFYNGIDLLLNLFEFSE